MTIRTIPAASAMEPALAPIQGALRPRRSCETAADAQGHDADCGDDDVCRVEEMRREPRAKRKEEAADRPGGHDREPCEEEGPTSDARDARTLRGQAEAAALGDGLGHPVRAGEGEREQDEQDDVGEDA